MIIEPAPHSDPKSQIIKQTRRSSMQPHECSTTLQPSFKRRLSHGRIQHFVRIGEEDDRAERGELGGSEEGRVLGEGWCVEGGGEAYLTEGFDARREEVSGEFGKGEMSVRCWDTAGSVSEDQEEAGRTYESWRYPAVRE